MKKWKQRGFAFVLALSLTTGLLTGAQAAVSKETLNDAVQDTAEYMYRTVQDPQVGSIGGEWAVLGLARSGYDVPDSYYQDYYATVETYVKACDGKLHDKKYTEYSRVIVALSSIGKDARNVGGYDLTKPLGDYDKTIWQGLNGPIWALIALDSRDYPMPENPGAETQATRQMYIDRILECQLPDGGWSLFGGTSAASSGDGVSDPDITGMALQALAKYQDQPAVARATEEALACMSKKQNSEGGFSSWGTRNSESCVQIIVALCELGIPLDDPRFVKNGNTLLDNLMTFYLPGNGFLHTADGSGSNQMASEQAFYGLIAAQRLQDGRNSLYLGAAVLDVKGNLALHAVQIVVQAGGSLQKQRCGHAVQVERGAQGIGKQPLHRADGALRVVQVQRGFVVCRDDDLAHNVYPSFCVVCAPLSRAGAWLLQSRNTAPIMAQFFTKVK